MGTQDVLKELEAHYKRILEWVLPDNAIMHQGEEPATIRDKLRPDIMLVVLTSAERHAYLNASGDAQRTTLPANIGDKPRNI